MTSFFQSIMKIGHHLRHKSAKLLIFAIFFQLCQGGSSIGFVKWLQDQNKKVNEQHIAYILRETIKVSQATLNRYPLNISIGYMDQ